MKSRVRVADAHVRVSQSKVMLGLPQGQPAGPATAQHPTHRRRLVWLDCAAASAARPWSRETRILDGCAPRHAMIQAWSARRRDSDGPPDGPRRRSRRAYGALWWRESQPSPAECALTSMRQPCCCPCRALPRQPCRTMIRVRIFSWSCAALHAAGVSRGATRARLLGHARYAGPRRRLPQLLMYGPIRRLLPPHSAAALAQPPYPARRG